MDLEHTGFILVPAVSELSQIKFISFSGDYDGIEKHPFIEMLKYRLYFTVTNLGYLRGHIQKTPDLLTSEVDTNQKEKNTVNANSVGLDSSALLVITRRLQKTSRLCGHFLITGSVGGL